MLWSIDWCDSRAEIDISVSKLLGFETFANVLRVSVSVSENLVSEKSLGFGFGKFGIVKKVLVSVSVKILVSSFSAFEPQALEPKSLWATKPLSHRPLSHKALEPQSPWAAKPLSHRPLSHKALEPQAFEPPALKPLTVAQGLCDSRALWFKGL